MSNQTQTTRVASQGEREIVTERVFDAPREKVFQAFTDPKLIPHWWGPRGVTTTVEKMDVRVGGDWRFTCDGPDGATAFRGTYREITPFELVEQTFEWEGMPGHIVVERAEFEDLGGGRTKLRTRSLFHTTEERDGMLASGMEGGLTESYERLDELLAARSED
ncbi:MAG TPA: SRPBCC family protein [Thermoleophilaceae bacterium]|nr:SRPBCC family protein [Thermoleophilaceae bacterium]